MEEYDIVIIGGGLQAWRQPLNARHQGIERLLIQRGQGIRRHIVQCIHNDSASIHLRRTDRPEHAWRYIRQVLEQKISYRLNTMVVDAGCRKTDGRSHVS